MHCIGKPQETSVAFMLSESDCSRPTASGVSALPAVIPNVHVFVYVCFPEQMSLFAVHPSLTVIIS